MAMKKGMAIALGATAVVAAGWVGATWYTGKKMQARVEQMLVDVNQHFASEVPFVKLRLERRDYTRGVFVSQVRYALVLEQSDLLPPDFPVGPIEFDTRIEHGPFPLKLLARGAFAPVLAASHSELARTENVAPLFELTGGVPFYADDVVMHYDGRVQAQARIAPIRHANEEKGLTVEFSGLDLQSQGDALFAQTRVKGEGRVETLLFQVDGQARVLVSDIVLAFDNTLGKFGIMNGDASMKAGRMEFASSRAGDEGQVTVDDFVYRVGVGENDGALSIEATYGLGKLTLQTSTPKGMDGDLGGGEIVVKLDNLNGAALQELQQAYVTLMRAAMDGRDLDEVKDDVLPQLLSGGEKLMVNKPALSIAPRWQTEAGESRLAFAVGLMAPANQVEMFTNQRLPDDLILQLIERIDIDLTVSKPQLESLMTKVAAQERGMTPEQAAAQAAQQVRALAGMAEMFNIARNEGDNLVGTFRYADGVARLNGVEVPLQEYLPDLLDLAGAVDTGDDDDEDDSDFDDEDDDDDDEHDHDHDDDDDHDDD